MSCAYGFGRCGCDRPECVVDRAVRWAAAEACRAAIVSEYGSSWVDEGLEGSHLSVFPSREWACRAFPRYSDRPCPSCGYVPWRRPEWAVSGRLFGVFGRVYRVVAVGSTNRYARSGLHYEDFVRAEPVEGEAWSLPDAPASVDDVGQSLAQLFRLPIFRVPDLAGVL